MASTNPFGADAELSTAAGTTRYFSLRRLADEGLASIDALPYSIRVLLEACLRNVDGFVVTTDDVTSLAAWNAPRSRPG